MQYMEILVYAIIAIIIVYIVKSRRSYEGLGSIYSRNAYANRSELMKQKIRNIGKFASLFNGRMIDNFDPDEETTCKSCSGIRFMKP